MDTYHNLKREYAKLKHQVNRSNRKRGFHHDYKRKQPPKSTAKQH